MTTPEFDSLMAYATTEALEKILGAIKIKIEPDPHPTATEIEERRRDDGLNERTHL